MLRRTRGHAFLYPMHAPPTVTPPPLDASSALFLDVDGTLLEIAPRPELVRVPPELPKMLEQLARQRHGALALITGRTLADLDRLFQPWRGAAAGVHGAERRRMDGSIVAEQPTEPDRIAAAALDRMRPKLATLSDRWPGVWIEDKGRTVALHYRAVPERGQEIRAAVTQVAQRESEALRPIAGKMVLELQPSHRHKGAAIAAFLTEAPFRGRQPLFVGDDATDEDGFAEVNRRGGVSVRVGPRTSDSVAGHQLPSVADVLNWLAAAAEG